MSAPQSTIHICSGVRLNNRYEHTIYFESRAAQQAYFAGKVVKSFSAYTFLRKSWPIKVQATMEQAQKWDYLFFTNDGSRYWYYFINDVEYINDNTVQLSLVMDVMQSYLAGEDYTLLPCFVERQHVPDDTAGLHTLEEGLDVGELVNKTFNTCDLSDLCIMVMSTINPNATTKEEAVPALPYRYNGVFSGIKIWAVDGKDWAAWGDQLDTLDSIGQSEAIVAMWMYPKELVRLYDTDDWDGDDIAHVVEEAGFDTYSPQRWPITLGTGEEPYTPRNNKLLCYPYNFLMATDNKGNFASYRYELFDGLTPNEAPEFDLSGALSPDGGAMLTPLNYKGLAKNFSESITLNGFPMCAWSSDMYKLWLAQNQNSHNFSNAINGLKVAGGVVVGLGAAAVGALPVAAAAGGVAISGAKQIADHLTQKADKDIVPPQAKGNFSTSVNITNDLLTFSFYTRTLRKETAASIDEYFDLYGYKINRVQTPEIACRENWTYVKTVGCHIQAKFGNADAAAIEAIFDKGITFWKYGDAIGAYFLPNDPV